MIIENVDLTVSSISETNIIGFYKDNKTKTDIDQGQLEQVKLTEYIQDNYKK